jgi:hyperosmotically inducible protein
MKFLNALPLAKIATLALLLAAAGPGFADKTTGQMVDDSIIQGEVKAKLIADDLMGGMGVNLETRKGVVQLGGFVDDVEKGKKLAEIAASVEGVVKVDNQLHPKSGDRSIGQITDDGITTGRVKTAIATADLSDGVKVNVDTYNGVVLLTGFVDTVEDKQRAGELAAADNNTREVINGIYVFD